MNVFDRLVFLLAKCAAYAIKRLGRGGGSAFPGLLVERLDKRLLLLLCDQLIGVVVVCGTNGKTTTARLIASLIEQPARPVVHNRSGSNLTRGILSALIQQASWKMALPKGWGIFEVDEAVLPSLLPLLRPAVVVVTNLFRDQLDRYGEVDTIAAKWRPVLAGLPAETTLVLNADDPLVASLAKDDQAVFYGLTEQAEGTLPSYADSRRCPVCQRALTFSSISYSHLGNYTCPNGDFSRPQPTLWAEAVQLRGMKGSDFTIRYLGQAYPFALGLAGVYNIYNVLAAVLAVEQIGISVSQSQKVVAAFESVFGRLEEVRLGETTLTLVLVKNPTGFNQVIQTLLTEPRAEVFWLLLNDRLADGRDVSWIWDVEIEPLVKQMSQVLVGGSRAADMALRLKYAYLPEEYMRLAPTLADGLRTASVVKTERIYCLCTYTAMLDLRQLLAKQQKVKPFYQD